MSIKKTVSSAFLSLLLALTLLYPQTSMQACRQAVSLWAIRVFPSLFPYLILSRLLLDTFRHPTALLLLSMLGGAPSGAALLETRNDLSARQLRFFAVVCSCASPAFLLGALGARPGLLICHWLSALLSALPVSLISCPAAQGKKQFVSAAPSGASISDILSQSCLSMITVCGCMAFYASVAALLQHLLPLSSGSFAALYTFLEMAGGCRQIKSLQLTPSLESALLCAAVSFGGLSIFTQNAVHLRRCGVHLPLQFAAKLLHALAAFFLTLFYFSVFE